MTLSSFDSKLTRFTVTFPKHTLLTPEVLRWIEGRMSRDSRKPR